MNRNHCPGDVRDDEVAFVAPYLTLMRPDAPQRVHGLRGAFNGVRAVVRAGAHRRMLPHDLAPWEAAYQQARRWLEAGSPAAIVRDLRAILRVAAGRRGRRRRSSTPAPRSPRRRAGCVPATAGTSGAKARRCSTR